MNITIDYNDAELASDLEALQKLGLKEELAEEVAEFKRIIDEAAHRLDAMGYPDKKDLGEDLFNALERASEAFQEAFFEIRDIIHPDLE